MLLVLIIFIIGYLLIQKIKKLFVCILVVILIYNIFTFNSYSISEFNEDTLFFHVLKISLIGSLIMIYAMYHRQNAFFKRDQSSINIFYKDIYYGIALVLILPVLDIIGGSKFFSILLFSWS